MAGHPESVHRHADVPGAGATARRHLRGQAKVGAVMGEFKRGTLRSGGGPKVTSRKQAVAIAMSEAGLSKPKNAPIFPGPSSKNEAGQGVARWEEPLSGPANATVGNPPGMTNPEGFYQNQAGQEKDLGSVPFRPAGIQDSDFPDKSTFSKGTAKAVDTDGLI